MSTLPYEVLDIIYRYKHQIEFSPVIKQLKRLCIILSDEMFEHRIPLTNILNPIASTKTVYFRVSVLDTTHLKRHGDYANQLDDKNIKKFQYDTDPYNAMTKFTIK